MRQIVSAFVQEALEEMYPDRLFPGLHPPIAGNTLDEVRFSDANSEIGPLEADISTTIGNINLAVPFIPASMDTLAGPQMAKVMNEIGTFCPLFRHPNQDIQLSWAENVLNFDPCLIKNPKSLHPDDRLYKAKDILDKDDYSTIPIVDDHGILLGVLFTGDIAFTEIKEGLEEPVKKRMRGLEELKLAKLGTPFSTIKQRLIGEERCSVLPIVDDENRLHGIYFMKDVVFANPSTYNGKSLVGMAISDDPRDLERVRTGIDLGVGVFVIDSSHGCCKTVIKQTTELAKIKKETGNPFVIISGNTANPDGYYRLALAGADAIKVGIGSGSICTTSGGTGVGVPMFTALQQQSFLRNKMRKDGLPTPQIIADGGVGNTGNLTVALAAGANLGMSGEWFVAAAESISANNGKDVISIDGKGYVRYRGMASDGAIKDRSSVRYGKGKTAAEGITGFVLYRGPLKTWIRKDIELIKGGFAHTGSKNIDELHEFGNWPFAFERFSAFGKSQLETRIKQL